MKARIKLQRLVFDSTELRPKFRKANLIRSVVLLLATLTLSASVTWTSQLVGQESEQDWTITEQNRFTTKRIEIESILVGEHREVLVALPTGYEHVSIGFPLLIVLDGEYAFDHVVSIVSFLARAGSIPPMIVVGIINTDRERDFTPKGLQIAREAQGGDRFLDFMEKELLPGLEKKFQIDGPRVLLGHSSGGLIASYAHARRPDLFDAVIALDAPFHLDSNWLPKQLINRANNDTAIPIRLIVAENRFSFDEANWKILLESAPEGSILDRFTVKNETHQSMDFQGSYGGLKLLYYDYSLVSPKNNSVEAIDAAYTSLSGKFGGTIHPPHSIYMRSIDDCLLEVRVQEAEKLLAQLIKQYGESPSTQRIKERVASARSAPPLEETVKDLVNGKKASANEIRDYVGSWQGTIQSPGGQPMEITFVVEIEAEKALGKIIHARPNGKQDEQELVVIRFRDGALQLGYMNGMNPRGVLLSSLRFNDATKKNELEGELRLAGMRFELPNGRKIPHMEVKVKRQKE